MTVKIQVITPAIALNAEEKKLTAPKWLKQLDGVSYSHERCSDYFEFSSVLDEAGVSGGEIRLRYNSTNRKLESIVSYECERRLGNAEKTELVKETRAQLSDGIGEGEFHPPAGSSVGSIDLLPTGAKTTVRQSELKNLKVGTKPKTKKVNVHAAATKGDLKTIQSAIDSGVDIDKPSKGFTPLALAVGSGHLDVVKLLVEHGASLKARDPMDFAPLHTCIASAQIKGKMRESILRVLLDAGANVNADSEYAGRPLDIAVNYGRGKAIKEMLIKSGAKKS